MGIACSVYILGLAFTLAACGCQMAFRADPQDIMVTCVIGMACTMIATVIANHIT